MSPCATCGPVPSLVWDMHARDRANLLCKSYGLQSPCRLSGYDYRFGIIHVDFTDGLVRYAKESAKFLAAWFSGVPLQGSSTVSSSSIG